MKNNTWIWIGLIGVAMSFGANAAITTAITTYTTAPDLTGITFASSATNFTPAEADTAGAGVPAAILGPADHPPGNNSPFAATIVDLAGVVVSVWKIDLGFGTAFTDGPGTDLVVYGTQLNADENFQVLTSADGINFSLVGTFDAPASPSAGTFFVAIDFNGMLAMPSASFLRLTIPAGVSRGFDFDAVGVTHLVPIPAAVWLFGSSLGLLGGMRRKAA